VSAAYEFAAEAGGLRTRVGDAEVSLRPCGALWLPAEGALVVADLHLEKGSSYAARGQMLPPYDTAETLTRLEAEVAALLPRQLVFLGDSFHDLRWEARIVDADLSRVRALGAGRELIWVVGNHDADSPKTLPGCIVEEIVLAGLTLRHEPAPGPAPGEVSGHLHPCAKVAGRGRSVRRRCFVTDAARLILPAFGAYAGGLNVKDAAFAGLFTRPPLTGALGVGRVHPIGWGSLRGD
jgi:uncharacterized protein